MKHSLFVMLLLTIACSGNSSPINLGADTADTAAPTEIRDGSDSPDLVTPDGQDHGDAVDVMLFDQTAIDAPDALTPGCEPGEGCFLDPCEANSDCLSGWCVEHLGDSVCTQTCQEECPPGWSCKLLGGGGPDPVYACVSNVSNLCKPCATNADCKAPGAQDDVCVSYAEQGSFCGGACTGDDDCPWGFSCLEATTTDGISTPQCFADAGVCPCSAKSVALSLATPCSTASESGTCSGKRVCTEEGLTECNALVAVAETCNGLDDDCDGDVDEPTAQGGNLVNLCDDGNACTVDTCLGIDGCQQEALEAGECIDGDACTVGDHCAAGECVGTPIDCDDGDGCTDDFCDGLGGCSYEPNNADCDDGNACTVADECNAGECVGVPVNCECQVDADCAQFEDGDLCNGTLLCDTATLPYQCRVDTDSVVDCPPLEGESAVCNAAECNPETGACEVVPAPDGSLCSDDDLCTVTEHCVAGSCQDGVAVNCNDGNFCTDDACNPETGCFSTPNSQACEDGNVCTAGDACEDGICTAGPAVDCDDGNPCTTDSCVPGLGCKHEAAGGACDDGNACTTGDACSDGKCVYADLIACDDGNECTTDGCDPASGCTFKLNSAPCDDGDLCTTGDYCHLGECVSSGTLPCDDQNPCTDDACSPDSGCQFTPNDALCDDGTDCTVGDQCSNGWCLPGPTVDCDDGNLCTDDSCDPEIGCVNTDNMAPCEDGNACTQGDTCNAGACVPGNVLTCDDASPCTVDSCDPDLGCQFIPQAGSCDDGDACTVDDTCQAGVCVPGAPLVCNDTNPCTDDSCAAQSGCLFVPNQADCSDDDACTDGDTCTNGACIPGPLLACDDDNVCTDDACDSQTGCTSAPVENGTECGPDKTCVDGVCTNCGDLHGSQSFGYTGSVQTFIVPDCVTSLTVTASAAQGGKGQKGAPGLGGRVVATVSVTPGETLHVYVGGQGAQGSGSSGGAGGYNGGGKGTGYSNTCYTGGGGGGASDVRQGGTGLSERIVVAGGGGGGGGDPATCNASWGGAGGGLTGQDAQPSVSSPDSNGKGGKQNAGGAGGSWSNGSAGTLGNGGQAGSAGGGGGGGYYGGGGGGHGGGGGASNYTLNSASNVTHSQGVQSGNGSVVITW